ncbi:hypothetical protein [Streptomyces tendae]|uniref:hypothetical protein n=1 Tax=Streptomyces tendae TaxID=1932 RepID=UPI0037177884
MDVKIDIHRNQELCALEHVDVAAVDGIVLNPVALDSDCRPASARPPLSRGSLVRHVST